MKAIYSIILVCFLVVVVTTVSAENKGNRDIRKYQAELKLTPQQMQQLNTIYNNQQARKTLQAPVGNFEQKAIQNRAENKEARQAVFNVLTKEQKKQYRSMMGVQRNKKTTK